MALADGRLFLVNVNCSDLERSRRFYVDGLGLSAGVRTAADDAQPGTAFGLTYGVNSIAMPMIGGTTSWIGPVIGAVLLGTASQVATVTISSEMNLFIVGGVLVLFVVLAPEGILGLVRRVRGR